MLMIPKKAAPIMQVSRATITRCVQQGAPVHRRGAAGRQYLIDPDEFIRWMERREYKKPIQLSTYKDKADAFRRAAMAGSR